MRITILSLLSFCLFISSVCKTTETPSKAKQYVWQGVEYDVFTVNLKKDKLSFHYKNKRGKLYRNFKNLKTELNQKGQSLIFATNGGIYDKGNIPKGLYVENGKTIGKLDRRKGGGNYYLKPNGVVVIYDDNTVTIMETEAYYKLKSSKKVKYALQSGPLLFSETVPFHPAFNKGSKSKYIRNGVGMINDHQLVFAITNQPVNLYTFGKFFQTQLGCKAGLYLDGYISRMYLPELDRTNQTGNFASIIAVTED